MESVESRTDGWETQGEVEACLAATDITMDQVRRWRRDGLLPDVVQKPTPYSGSTVIYPVGTCMQIAAAAQLFKIKNRVAYVGWQLWWEGFPVDEKYWKPLLASKADFFDRTIARIKVVKARDEDYENRKTLEERIAKSDHTNIIMSRIRGRQSGHALATTLTTAIQVATGEFEQFSVSEDATEGDNAERALTIDALDLEASMTDKIIGWQLHLARELPNIYKLMARAFSNGPLSQILREPEQVIFLARNDVRNAFRIAVAHYNATRWIYGPTAFGLRLAAWIGERQPEWLMPLFILGFAHLRQSSNTFLSSAEIENLAKIAEKEWRASMKVKSLWQSDPRYRLVFNPKNIRKAFGDGASYNAWLKEAQRVAETR